MRRKLKLAIFCMCLCWIVAFAQFAMTRFYLSHNDATQAFARNQLIKGHLSGEMTSSQKEQLASRLFHVWGGAIKDTRQTSDYYVAYGYTSGIAFCKKINGQKINLNLAITYNEISDETTVYLGVPLLNTDF